MSNLTKLKQDIYRQTVERLKMYDFKRQGNHNVCNITNDVTGSVGLNTATYAADNIVIFNPVVAISHQKLVELLEELVFLEPSRQYVAIVSRPIGYLMPEHSYKEWEFKLGRSVDPIIDEMVRAIITYGKPWMESHVEMEQLAEEGKKWGLIGFGHFIPPIAWIGCGQIQKAIEFADLHLQSMKPGGWSYDQYKEFLERIRNIHH